MLHRPREMDAYGQLARIPLTIPSTITSAERSFNNLKLITDFDKLIMSQEHFADLAMIGVG